MPLLGITYQLNSVHDILFYALFNIVLPSTSRFLEWCFPAASLTSVFFSLLTSKCVIYKSRASQLCCSGHSRNRLFDKKWQLTKFLLISNFRRVLSVVWFLLGNSPASEFYMLTFRDTLFHLHRWIGIRLWRWNRECSETSAYKIQPLGNYPEEGIQNWVPYYRIFQAISRKNIYLRLLSLNSNLGQGLAFHAHTNPRVQL
jgi:hypothetical protein